MGRVGPRHADPHHPPTALTDDPLSSNQTRRKEQGGRRTSLPAASRQARKAAKCAAPQTREEASSTPLAMGVWIEGPSRQLRIDCCVVAGASRPVEWSGWRGRGEAGQAKGWGREGRRDPAARPPPRLLLGGWWLGCDQNKMRKCTWGGGKLIDAGLWAGSRLNISIRLIGRLLWWSKQAPGSTPPDQIRLRCTPWVRF